MIVDQLFTPKTLKEGGPYDLPGKDYPRPGDSPRKRPSGEHNPYPYSPEEDDDHFREIFRKKREAAAKDQGMAEATAAPTAGVPAPGVAKPAVATQPATAPAQDPSQPYLDKLGARAGAAPGSNITQVTDAYQQKLLDRMGKRFGLPPGSTADQVQAAQQAYLNKNDPTAAAQYKQNMTNIDAGNTAANKPVQLAPKPAPAAAPATAAPAPAAAVDPSVEQKVIDDIAKGQGLPTGMTRDELMVAWKKKVTGQFSAPTATPAQPVAEGTGRAVNDKGLTQHRWLQLVQTKFPDAKIVQAKMIDGPCRATLPDGRTLSWTKVDQGVAEGPTDDPRFQKMMGNIQKSTPKYVPVTGYVAVSFASEQGSKKIKGVSRNGKPIPTNIGDPDQFLSGKIEFTPDQVEQQLMSIGKKYGWDSIDSGQSQGFTEMFFDTAKEYTSNNYPYLATNIVKTVREINKFFADINKSLQTTGLSGYVSDVWQGMGPPENTNQIEDLDQIISIAKKTAPKADPGPEIGKVILANYKRFGGEDGYSRSELDQAAKIAKIYITQGERAGFKAQHNSDVSDMIDELLSDAGSDVRTIYTDDPLNPMQIEDQGVAEKVGDLRPKLGTARDKGKSVRKWRNDRGLNESKPLQNSQVYNLGHKSLSEALELYFGKNSKPISEGNRNNQLRLMEETTFRNGYAFARLLVEKNLTKDQVLQLFKDVEQGATDAGGNRTGLGKAKDATTQAIGKASKLVQDAMQWARERPTMQAVDTEYNRAMTALGKLGGKDGEANAITQAIYKYRDAAKKYPRATGLAKWAIISAASLVTGGLGGAGVAAGLAAIDAAIKDKDVTDIVGASVQAALVSGAIQGAGQLASMASDAYYGMPSASEIAANNAALGDFNDTDIPGGPASNVNALDLPGDAVPNVAGDTSPVPGEYSDAANNAYQQNPDPSDAPVDPNTRADYTQPDAGSSTYTVTADDVKGLGKIAQDNGLTAKQLWDANPQITDPDKIFVGQEINMPAASGEPVKNVWQDWDGPTKPTAPAVEPGPGDTVPTLTTPDGAPIDYSLTGPMSTDSQGQKLEFGIPVTDTGNFVPPNPNLPADELAKQTAAYNSWKADFMKRNPNIYIDADGNQLQIMAKPTLPAVQESIKFKIIPAEQLIDQKLTVLSWALNESVNRKGQQSVHLTTKGVRTVFENIGRCRRAYLKEYIGAPTADYGHPTAAGAPASATAGQGKPQGWFGKTLDTIGRGVDKVGSYVSNVGHNVITKVTADKLNNMWNRAGEPYDSDRLYQLLTTEWGVPKQVVDSVFSKMGIPYTAPATVPAAQTATPAKTGGAQKEMPQYGTNPATGKIWTYDELVAPETGLTPAPGATTGTATNPNVAAAYNASLKAGKPASIPKSTVTPTTMGARRTNVKKPIAPTATNITSTYGQGFKNSNQSEPQGTVLDLDKFKKDRAAKQDFAKSGYMAPASESRIAAALKRPVAEMLQMVETKEDVQRIKQFVDDTFVKYGAVNESSFAVRNQILEHVTQTGAQRRREHSQRVAH